MSEKLLSVLETASMLNLSPHTIRAWIQNRRIRYYKLGRRTLISPQTVRAFLEDSLVELRVDGAMAVGTNSFEFVPSLTGDSLLPLKPGPEPLGGSTEEKSGKRGETPKKVWGSRSGRGR